MYEFVSNDAFSTNTFFANRIGSPRQALRDNRYGATIGGLVVLTTTSAKTGASCTAGATEKKIIFLK